MFSSSMTYATEDVKVERSNECEISICQACLSSDRVLTSLGDCEDVYQNISLNSYSIQSELYFCWECTAMLKKIKLFKEKLRQAQRILRYQNFNQQNRPKTCLSKLTTTKINTENIIILYEQEQDTDNKYNIKIKQEIDFENESLDDNYLEEIKVEEKLTHTLQNVEFDLNEKKERAKKYRMILNTTEGRASRKIRIGIEELDMWLIRERNSIFYQNLANKCDKCVTKLSRKQSLDEHNKSHHDETMGRYTCDICQTHFATKSSVASHVAGHYYVRHCNICGYECYTSGHMNNHMEGHKKTVQCLDCHACYNNVRQFYKHYKAMHCDYICDHCDKRCKSKHSLEKHMRRHATQKCKKCNLNFKSYFTLRRHMKLKHVVKCTEDAFCVPCDRQFKNALVYRRHVSTSAAHRHERRGGRIKKEKVPCPECDNVYSRRSYMMNHYRHVHRNESKYYCADCDKYFLNRTRYLDHRRYNHEGYVREKDKLCNICGRGFAANRTLTNHMRTHSGERPYVCTYCDSKFTQKQAMLSHVKFIHLKDRRKPDFV